MLLFVPLAVFFVPLILMEIRHQKFMSSKNYVDFAKP